MSQNNININKKSDENIDERRKIADYLAQTFSDEKKLDAYYFMLKDKTIYDFDSYQKLIKSNKVLSNVAYVHFKSESYSSIYNIPLYGAAYFHPFLSTTIFLTDAYSSKLGFYGYMYRITPATDLKYVAVVNRFPYNGSLVVEVADVVTTMTNLNLLRIIHSVLGTSGERKYLSDDDVEEIEEWLSSQKLFAGYNFSEAKEIVYRYYVNNDTSLVRDVEAIRETYNRIFQPHRVVYDVRTKQPVQT